MAKQGKRIYVKYAEELKKNLLRDDIKFLKAYGDDGACIEYKRIEHGHWVVDEDGNIKCSECGHHGVGDNYCERCGTRMDEVEDDES